MELLIVIAVISIIATVIFVAVDPATRLAQARNATRWQETKSILEAIKLYQVDNDGSLPSGIDTTLRMLGTDASGCDVSCGGSSDIFTDETQTEFDAGTYSDTQWDSGNSWIELTATGLTNGSGDYTSSIKDGSGTSSWDNISWTPNRPVGKELPNNKGTESGYSTGNADMSGNTLLMHMNENTGSLTFSDDSGSGNAGSCSGGACPSSVTGKLNTALDFDGNDVINISESTAMNFTSAVSYGAWFKADSLSNWAGIISRIQSWPNGYNLQVGTTQRIACGWGTYTNSDNMPVTGQWYHAVCVYDGTQMRLYVNGVLQSDIDTGTLNQSANDMKIGVFYTSNSLYFDGQIDEVFVFNRALSATEVADIYKRGALKLKHQVRSCDDAACSGETFIGPDGTSSTYYEWGTTNSTSTPSFSLTNVADNQYFQYKAYFETDDTSFTPELKNITIDYSDAGSSTETTDAACLDLTTDLVDEYLAEIPIDPKDGTSGKTYYAVKQISSSGGNVKVISCGAELSEEINSSR